MELPKIIIQQAEDDENNNNLNGQRLAGGIAELVIMSAPPTPSGELHFDPFARSVRTGSVSSEDEQDSLASSRRSFGRFLATLPHYYRQNGPNSLSPAQQHAVVAAVLQYVGDEVNTAYGGKDHLEDQLPPEYRLSVFGWKVDKDFLRQTAFSFAVRVARTVFGG